MSELGSDSTNENIQVIEATISDRYAQKLADAYALKIEEYAPLDFYMIDIDGVAKRFNRRKAKGKERYTLEKLRMKLKREIRSNSLQAADTEDELYKKAASYYLIDPETGKGMTGAQFDEIAFEDLKPILDACSFRTEKPIPPLESTTTPQ